MLSETLSTIICCVVWPLNVKIQKILYCHIYHVGQVIKVCELVEADGETSQSSETGNLFNFTQIVVVKVKHLQVQYIRDRLLWVCETASKPNASQHRGLTMIWLRILARATLCRILSSKPNNLGCVFRTGSKLRAASSRKSSLEFLCLITKWLKSLS